VTFIEIKHPDYGKTEYWFPEDLCDFCGYEMVVQYVNNNVHNNTYISVDTEPSGADIYIDGKHYGQTPNIITDLPMGKHEIKLEKQEYNSVTKIFIIEDGEKLKFNETLQSVYYKPSSAKENEKEVVDNSATDSNGNEVFNVKGVSFKMIKVEGGTFMMGATSEQGKDASKDEKPAHSVTLSDYYIGETEVTQELWEAVMGSTPSSYSGYPQRPVERVSWNDCQEFITKLNQLTGKNFRLPTEAEWEYAARGGNKSKGYKYSGGNTIGNVAWCTDNSGSRTHNVKTKQANELGIYDMSGNVCEWCQDWYGKNYYQNSLQTNPTGPTSGSSRVLRGGSWGYDARYCRVSYRGYYYPDYRDFNRGLRLVL
jgi:formylglycine-generating enzyme required for sulfatase activity